MSRALKRAALGVLVLVLLGLAALASLLLSVLPVRAAPFLVADVPSAAADTCVFTSAAGAVFTSPVVTDAALGLPALGNRICKVDLAGTPAGTNAVKLRLRASAQAALWGDSAEVPFSFVRPDTAPPASLRLAP